jgi:hypothetical protein
MGKATNVGSLVATPLIQIVEARSQTKVFIKFVQPSSFSFEPALVTSQACTGCNKEVKG